MKLSLLIPGIPERWAIPGRVGTMVPPGVTSAFGQACVEKDVEVLYLVDPKKRSVGAKRNALLDLAQGEYLSFIDDDDTIADDYVRRVLHGLERRPGVDVLCFIQHCWMDGGPLITCRYSVKFDYLWDGGPNWYGKPAHTMIWKSEIAKRHRFPEKNFGEDKDWATRCSAEVRNEGQIEHPLYFYRFDSKKTATRDGR